MTDPQKIFSNFTEVLLEKIERDHIWFPNFLNNFWKFHFIFVWTISKAIIKNINENISCTTKQANKLKNIFLRWYFKLCTIVITSAFALRRWSKKPCLESLKDYTIFSIFRWFIGYYCFTLYKKFYVYVFFSFFIYF